MNSFTVVGYVLDCDVYCVDCLTGNDREIAYPIFASSEWDHYPVCNECGATLDEVSLIQPDTGT